MRNRIARRPREENSIRQRYQMLRRHKEGGDEHLAKDKIRKRVIFNTELKPIYSHLEGTIEG